MPKIRGRKMTVKRLESLDFGGVQVVATSGGWDEITFEASRSDTLPPIGGMIDVTVEWED